jgi:hypothetical protein
MNQHSDIKALIEQTRAQVATAVNASLTLMCWQIGKRISKDILSNERATYGDDFAGEQIVVALSRQLSVRNLAHTISFAEGFPSSDILQALCAKLSWGRLRTILKTRKRLENQEVEQ